MRALVQSSSQAIRSFSARAAYRLNRSIALAHPEVCSRGSPSFRRFLIIRLVRPYRHLGRKSAFFRKGTFREYLH
jgi:hypothetical protein